MFSFNYVYITHTHTHTRFCGQNEMLFGMDLVVGLREIYIALARFI